MTRVALTINGNQLLAESGSNLLEAALANDVNIPHLCYDPRLAPFGSCRLCFVEIAGMANPVPACSLKVVEEMEVITDSEAVRKLRKMALELLMAEHCGDCLPPCQQACPADVNIQGFVAHLNNGDYQGAVELIMEKMPIPSICGRVCPRFCEQKCRRNLVDDAVDVCGLKRFAGDFQLENINLSIPQTKESSGYRVAVVGGGPAGLTAAYFLALQGHQITLYDAGPELGGMLRYGIPEYRLPNDILDREIEVVTSLCHDVQIGKVLGRDFSLPDLRAEYDAVFLGIGCQTAQKFGLPKEDLPGIYAGIDFLREVTIGKPPRIGDRVAVIGGGNTAMDAARTALRLGAKQVMVVYRRSREEMPAEPLEIQEAMEEGVEFHFLTNPAGFVGEAKVKAVECIKMELGEPDSSGRRRPIEVKDSEFLLQVDSVILAIGQKTDQDIVASLELPTTRWGTIETDEKTGSTSVSGVFVAGDCVSGAATVVEAVGAARKGAISIHAYLQNEPVLPEENLFAASRGELHEINKEEYATYEKKERVIAHHLGAEERSTNFSEYAFGLSEEEVSTEGARCLECGCLDAHQCELRKLASEYGVTSRFLGQSEKRYEVNESHPHITHDPNKCILCGKCVQICKEVAGVSALGFVNRGYDTLVRPALELPLAEVCTSCGDCVSACPTGALTVNNLGVRRGPWEEKVVQTTCLQCDIGCAIQLHLVNNIIVSASSPLRHPVSQGSLCKQGSFDYDFVHTRDRLNKPLVKNNGQLEEISWDGALHTIAQRMLEISNTYGSESLAVLISPRLANEEQELAYKLAKVGLNTENVYSTRQILPQTSLITNDEIETSDFVVVIDTDLVQDYPIIGHRVRKNREKGGHVIEIKSIANLSADIIEGYRKAHRPVIIVDGETIGMKSYNLLRESVGHRISVLSKGGNTRGQILETGIQSFDENNLRAKIHSQEIKAVIVIGDERNLVSELITDKVFTVAIASAWRGLTHADVLLPAATFVETDGTVVNSEGRVQSLKAARNAPSGKQNGQVLAELCQVLRDFDQIDSVV